MSEADMIIESLKNSGKKVEEFYMSNKTSDKNVANVEELIQEYRTYNDLDGIQDLSIYVNALENILAEREQMLKAINTVEKEKGDWIKAYQEEKDSQFDLLKRIKELEEEVKMLDEAYTGTIKESKKWFDIAHNSIPTQVVIDKIKENKQILDKTNDGNLRERLYIENGIMKELLEGEK